VDDQAADAYGDVVLRHRELRDEWFLPQPLTVGLEPSGAGQEIVWRGTATVDPSTVAGGAPLRPGKQDFYLRLNAFGWARQQRLGADREAGLRVPDLFVEAGGRLVERFDTDPHRNLSLNVAVPKERARTLLARSSVQSATRTRVVLVPNAHLSSAGGRGTLGLRRADGHRTSWPLEAGDGSTWVAQSPNDEPLRPGTYELTLSAPGPWGAVRLLEVVVVSPFGVSSRRATAGPTTVERLTGFAARARRSLKR
jgi:hypothetical protein